MRESVTEIVANQKAFLEKKLEIVEKILADSPEGELQVHYHDKRYYYGIRSSDQSPNPSGASYISRSSKQLPVYIRKYCARKLKPCLNKAIKTLCTKPLEFSTEPIQKQYQQFEQYFGELVPRCFETREAYIRRWQSAPYGKNPFPFEEGKAYHTERGETVRSKNECLCADFLFQKGLPYKYDAAFKMNNGQTVYTDFIILNPKNWELYYIELFGLMSDNVYVEKNMKRLSDYADSGILLGDRLFVFFESEETPFNFKAFRKTIEKIFC